jgi:uncharacterized protein involved in outer membrane biogenesis
VVSARKIALFGLPLITLFLSALTLLNLNRIIELNKKHLLARAGQSLGRNLTVERIRVSLWKGIGVGLKNIDLSDDSAFSSDSFLRAGEMQISLPLGALLNKEFQIKRLTLHNPEVTIIRDEEGHFNFSTIGSPQTPPGIDKEARKRAAPREINAASLFLLPVLDITKGTLRYTDKKERVDLPVSHIDLRVEELVTGKLFLIKLSAAVLTEKPNIKLEARLALGDATMNWVDIPLDARITVDSLDTGKLKAAVPKIRSYLPLGDSGLVSFKDLRVTGSFRKLRLGAHPQ